MIKMGKMKMSCVNTFAWKAKMTLNGRIALLLMLGLLLAPSSYAVDMVVNAEQSLEWNQKEAFYHAMGNAKALQGKKEIRAESLKAFYDPQNAERTITRIIANGNVSFADENHEGRGRKLDYSAINLTYLLNGPSAVISGPDGQTAEQTIIFKRAVQMVELKKNASTRDGRHLSGQEIIIYLDDADNISRITASGNVTIIQANGSTALPMRLTTTGLMIGLVDRCYG